MPYTLWVTLTFCNFTKGAIEETVLNQQLGKRAIKGTELN